MKKILYISYDGLTDPLGQSQILPYLVALSKKGYRFTILSFEKKERFEKEKEIIKSIIEQAEIRWVPLWFTKKPPVLAKMWDHWRLMKTAKRLYQTERFDGVHCRSYIAAEAGLMLKKKFGVKLIFDMRGFWADEKVENGQWNLKNPVYKTTYRKYKNLERELLLNADAIVTLTDAAKDYLLQQPEYKQLQIDVIPCCADLSHFDFQRISTDEKKKLRSELGLKDDQKLITYLGSVGGWYMTKEMFAFFKQLEQSQPQYKMLMLTKDDPEAVKTQATALGIQNGSLLVTYAQRQQLPRYLAISDLGLFFINNSFSKTASSPTKHAELMGMGIPVICNDIGDTGRIVSRTNTGVVVNEFEENSFKEIIGSIDQLLATDKQKIRHCALDIFDLNAGVDKYATIYQRLFH
ncbi:MAG: glycosyltransferase family 4 protein [Flavisolibacter sp.]